MYAGAMGERPRKSTKKPPSKPPRSGPPGGRRGEVTEATIIDAVEYLLIHRAGRQAISNALTAEYGRPPGTPIPLNTVETLRRSPPDRIRRGHELVPVRELHGDVEPAAELADPTPLALASA